MPDDAEAPCDCPFCYWEPLVDDVPAVYDPWQTFAEAIQRLKEKANAQRTNTAQ